MKIHCCTALTFKATSLLNACPKKYTAVKLYFNLPSLFCSIHFHEFFNVVFLSTHCKFINRGSDNYGVVAL